MADVFISYTTTDSYLATELCECLEKNGISCWISPRNCSADEPYSLQISTAIKECKTFVVLISTFSNESEHVRNEVDLAFNAGKDIICYRLTNVKPADDLNYYLGRKRWIDATSDGRGALEVVATIQKRLKGAVPTKTVAKKVFSVVKSILGFIILLAVIFVIIIILRDIVENPDMWKEKSIVEYCRKIADIVKGFDYKGAYEKIAKVVNTLLGKK